MSSSKDPTKEEMAYVNERLRALATSSPTGEAPYEVDLLTRLPSKRIIGLVLYQRPDRTDATSVWDKTPEGYQLYERWRVRRVLRFSRPINLGHKMNQGDPKLLTSWSKDEEGVSERVMKEVNRELDRGTFMWVQ